MSLNPIAQRVNLASVTMEDTKHPELVMILKIAAEEIQRLQNLVDEKPQFKPIDEGKLWSYNRDLLTQGMAIQQDIASYPSNTHLSVHLDGRARDRSKDFLIRVLGEKP